MATKKNSNRSLNINPNLQISFVSAEDVRDYQDNGYQMMMAKMPMMNDLPNLTQQEFSILSHLMVGKAPKEIALIIGMSERSVNLKLSNLRKKLQCRNNIQLATKLKCNDNNLFSLMHRVLSNLELAVLAVMSALYPCNHSNGGK